MQSWAAVLKKARKKINLVILVANNHYAGFGPSTANGFRKMMGMEEVVWEEMKQATLD